MLFERTNIPVVKICYFLINRFKWNLLSDLLPAKFINWICLMWAKSWLDRSVRAEQDQPGVYLSYSSSVVCRFILPVSPAVLESSTGHDWSVRTLILYQDLCVCVFFVGWVGLFGVFEGVVFSLKQKSMGRSSHDMSRPRWICPSCQQLEPRITQRIGRTDKREEGHLGLEGENSSWEKEISTAGKFANGSKKVLVKTLHRQMTYLTAPGTEWGSGKCFGCFSRNREILASVFDMIPVF